jgi:hypothetical protein
VGVEKVRDRNVFSVAMVAAEFFVSTLATFRRKKALSDIGRLTSCAADTVLGGNFALVNSRARGAVTVPA